MFALSVLGLAIICFGVATPSGEFSYKYELLILGCLIFIMSFTSGVVH